MARARRSEETVRVKGLDDFRRELRRLGDEAGPDGLSLLKEANHKIASMVISKAQARASGVGTMQSRAAATLKAGRAQARATITGGSRVPFFFGAEFGSYPNFPRTRGSRTYLGFNQFKPHKRAGSGSTGYFLYPTMKAESRNIIEIYGKELDVIAKKAFPD